MAAAASRVGTSAAPRTRAAALPWLVAALSAALSSAAIGFFAAHWDMPQVREAFYLQDAGIAMVFPAVGAVILSRRPGHPIGWLFLATASLGVAGAAAAYGLHALVVEPGSLPGGEWALWLTSWTWTPFLAVPTLLVLLFPDGRPPSPRWRPLARTALAAIVGMTVLGALLPGPLTNYEAPVVDNPLGVALLEPLIPLAGPATGAIVFVLSPLCLAGLVVRFRRAEGDERAQLKWFVAACVAAFAALAIAAALQLPLLAADAVWLAGLTCIPVAAGIAITRYRLYEIDAVINRTLVYGTLTVAGVAAYVAVVGALSAAISGVGASLLATGLIAVAFAPARDRLQRRVDRLLFGHRSDPYAALAGLGARLESTLPAGTILPAVAETIATALKLPYVGIDVVDDDGERRAASHGRLVGEPLELPTSYGGEPVGRLVVGRRSPGERFSAAEQRLLEDFARQAGATVHAVRLADRLLRSREELVTSREEERRRLRRDLHDGLGPTLAGLMLQVDVARGLLPDSPEEVGVPLGRLKAGLQDTVAEVRRLVHELRPPALDELGLAGALRQQADALGAAPRGVAAPMDVEVAVREPLPPLPAAVEVAAYRIATEALLNAARHSDADSCLVRLAFDGALEVEIVDDGRGLPAEPAGGVGLRSMRERAAELGGSCRIEPAASGGTAVRASLPVPA